MLSSLDAISKFLADIDKNDNVHNFCMALYFYYGAFEKKNSKEAFFDHRFRQILDRC